MHVCMYDMCVCVYKHTCMCVCARSVRAKHFLISEDGVVKLSGLRTVVPMIDEGTRLKVSESTSLCKLSKWHHY